MKRYQYYCFIAILLSAACGNRSETPKNVPPAAGPAAESPQPTPIAPEAEKSVREVISQLPFLEKEGRSALLRVWRQVPNQNAFRAVRPSDFNIPHWVEKEYYWPDVARATGWSSDYGEMSGAHGLIVFIVDKATSDINRFSVVVFIERPGNKYTLHWIFRDKDLSRVNLRRHSGDVYLQEFREDGTSHVCDVQWDRKKARWGCDLD